MESNYSYSKDSFLGKRVLVTGGTGFMGTAIIKELLTNTGVEYVSSLSRRWDDAEKLARELGDSRFSFVNGDIRDGNFVNRVTRDGQFDLIIHAAAYKSVPSAQKNPEECVSVNIKGSINVANAAKNYGVKAVVGISSDKACEPINVYGQTKAIMEQMFINSVTDTTNFLVCRYGNVIGSTGSVIPLFVKQLKRLDNLTVTDPDMTRFWFRERDAVGFILMSAGLAMEGEHRGKIFIPVLDSLAMFQLADYMIHFFPKNSDAIPEGHKIDVNIIGRRDGEKQHESMVGEHEDKGNMYLIWPENEKIGPASLPFSSENSCIYSYNEIDELLGDYLHEQSAN